MNKHLLPGSAKASMNLYTVVVLPAPCEPSNVMTTLSTGFFSTCCKNSPTSPATLKNSELELLLDPIFLTFGLSETGYTPVKVLAAILIKRLSTIPFNGFFVGRLFFFYIFVVRN